MGCSSSASHRAVHPDPICGLRWHNHTTFHLGPPAGPQGPARSSCRMASAHLHAALGGAAGIPRRRRQSAIPPFPAAKDRGSAIRRRRCGRRSARATAGDTARAASGPNRDDRGGRPKARRSSSGREPGRRYPGSPRAPHARNCLACSLVIVAVSSRVHQGAKSVHLQFSAGRMANTCLCRLCTNGCHHCLSIPGTKQTTQSAG